MLSLGIILILVSLYLSASAEDEARAEEREEQRHRELMRELREARDRAENLPSVRRHTERRIAKDSKGNTLAMETIDEEEL